MSQVSFFKPTSLTSSSSISACKPDILRNVLMNMSHEGIAKFIEENNLTDKLIAQEHKPVQWDVEPVACKAPAFNDQGETIDLRGEAAYKARDDYHSNQGVSGLSARHAVAKALLQDWRRRFGRRHPMNLQMMIAFLITSLPKGSESAKVTDFKTVKG